MLATHLRRNAVAYMALFIALGGTSYAAVSLPKNSVGSKQIKNNAVTGAKVKQGSLSQTDLSAAARAALRGAAGPAGPAGAAGAPGAKGDPGTPGSAGADAVLGRTRLRYTTSGLATDAISFEVAKAVGSFNKTSTSSVVRLSWVGTGSAPSGSCVYQLRVDGKTDAGATPGGPDTTSGGYAQGGGTLSLLTTIAEFSGLSAGPHDVEIWAVNNVTTDDCNLNPTARAEDVLVDEYR